MNACQYSVKQVLLYVNCSKSNICFSSSWNRQALIDVFFSDDFLGLLKVGYSGRSLLTIFHSSGECQNLHGNKWQINTLRFCNCRGHVVFSEVGANSFTQGLSFVQMAQVFLSTDSKCAAKCIMVPIRNFSCWNKHPCGNMLTKNAAYVEYLKLGKSRSSDDENLDIE